MFTEEEVTELELWASEHAPKRRRVEEAIRVIRKSNYDLAASLAFDAIYNIEKHKQQFLFCNDKEENINNNSTPLSKQEEEELQEQKQISCERTLEQVKINELWCEPVHYNVADNDRWETDITPYSQIQNTLNKDNNCQNRGSECIYHLWQDYARNVYNDKRCTSSNNVECSQMLPNELTDNERVMLENALKQRRRPCIFDVLTQTIGK